MHRSYLTAVSFFFVLCIGQLGLCQRELDPHAFDGIAPLVEQAIVEHKMPGAVVLIGVRNEVAYHRAFGNRQLLPEPLPMQLDTVFDLASLTKPIATATSIMLLVERHVLELDDPVAKHIPEFAANGKEHVTIRQLLIHTGGLIPDNAMSDYRGTRAEMVAKLFDLRLNYEPDKDFKYSDVGFQILGELIERKTQSSVAEFSKANIFAPLGMSETGYLPDDALKQRCAATQQRDDRWMVGEVHDPRAYAMKGVAGHAGLFSTAADIAIYAQMILGKGTIGDKKIMEAETIQMMLGPNTVPNGVRGLGWDKKTGYSSNRGKTMTDSAVGHGGFTGTGLWIDPELGLYVIFLSNRVHPDGKGSVNPLIGEIGTIAANAVWVARP